MKMSNLKSASTLLVVAVLFVSGCKLEVQVPLGGRVVSEDGSFVCEAGQTCVIDVVDFFFDQTFIAEPEAGYSFGSWRLRDGGYLCGGETGPCDLSTVAFEGNDSVQTMLESDETFFLRPVFVATLNCPKSDGLVVSPNTQSGH